MKLRLLAVDILIGYEVVAGLTAALLLDRQGRVGACLLAAVLHELGHLLVMRLCRCRVRRITVRLFDVMIEADDAGSVLHDGLITAGGAAANLVCAMLFCMISRPLMLANLVVGCFNLLPVETLDGGRLLMLLLCRRVSYVTATSVIRVLTFVFLLPLFTLGIYTLLHTRYNYSLLAISLYLLAFLFR